MVFGVEIHYECGSIQEGVVAALNPAAAHCEVKRWIEEAGENHLAVKQITLNETTDHFFCTGWQQAMPFPDVQIHICPSDYRSVNLGGNADCGSG